MELENFKNEQMLLISFRQIRLRDKLDKQGVINNKKDFILIRNGGGEYERDIRILNQSNILSEEIDWWRFSIQK
ncbi:unnamed protein product [Paramecium sonneborni]|uniref:Uncharacterized protein n=1 Tax=Paramecium sonneborni TaxID=65129 RepID=A0A8S1QPK0_9CILI|nr:unnamed protein product [Paramecium sonneborni]